MIIHLLLILIENQMKSDMRSKLKKNTIIQT